jgi:ribosomal protein S14
MREENSGRLAAKANELYWHTSRPAGHLADELGISRSKFYALIEPLRLEAKCEACGTPLAFSSRSDREAGRGRCPQCGATADVATERISAPPPAQPEPAAAEPPARPRTGSRIELPGSRELWLSTLAGVAVGMLLTALWRRR